VMLFVAIVIAAYTAIHEVAYPSGD
jgi:hypothetical protein